VGGSGSEGGKGGSVLAWWWKMNSGTIVEPGFERKTRKQTLEHK
jgi:hypothetical protein